MSDEMPALTKLICKEEAMSLYPAPDNSMLMVDRVRHEARLRKLTDIINSSHHFATNEPDRMKRIQAAYDLAWKLDDAVSWTRENGPYE